MSNRNVLVSIKSEVDEFHPLLKQLLPKLIDVIDVEYTHGPNEMGADFVISIRHATFNHIEYIGIIAKVGKIHQDFSDIEKQIEECDVPRLFRGGREKIRINEIWVMITDNITRGAQKKILEKYHNRKIEFIYGDKLEKLINNHCPEVWTGISPEVSEYLLSIKNKNEELDRSLSLLPPDKKLIYIKSDIIKKEYDEYDIKDKRKSKQNTNKNVNIFDEISNNKIVYVEGSMGSGKSKLLRHLVNYYADPTVHSENEILPIATTYKILMDEYGLNINKYITSTIGDDLLKNEKIKTYLILIDAVDENDISTEEQMKNIEELFNNINISEKVKAVIMSRPISNIKTIIESSASVVHCEILPLSLKIIIKFIKEICSEFNIANRIVEDLKKSQLFKEMPKTPISALLLAKLLNDNKNDIPSNITELYSKYTELVLGRWDIDKGLQQQKEYSVLSTLLMQIAQYMIDNELPAISIGEVKDYFDKYLGKRNLGIEKDQLFDKMTKRCDIIMIDYTNNIFTFKHRSFAEYLYAKLFSNTHKLKIDERAFDMYWMNIFFFYLGIIKDCPSDIDKLISLNPSSEVGRFIKIINISNYLLAAYTTPYELITRGVIKVMTEAALLFKDIIDGRIDTPLFELPRMGLLWFMQILIRQSYSYQFLLKAMDDAALEIIENDSLSNDIKAYSLFFIKVACIDTDKSNDFDFLLKEFKSNELPVDLTLAIHYESKDLHINSKLIKKHEKYINKNIRKNRSMMDYVNKLHKLPVSKYTEKVK